MATRALVKITGRVSLFFWVFAVISGPLLIAPQFINAQSQQIVRNADLEIIPEEGAPVAITSGRTELDLDAFGVPMAARTYLDYKNQSDKPVAAVKFRIRFTDREGKDWGTFHAPHGNYLAPGATSSEKWRSERVDPRTTHIKVRVLAVKFADGSLWESSKTQQLAKPASGDPLFPNELNVPAGDLAPAASSRIEPSGVPPESVAPSVDAPGAPPETTP